MKINSLLLILVLLVSCKSSQSVSASANQSGFTLTRYQRTQANASPIVVGYVSVNAPQEKNKPLSGTFFLDGQRITFHEADRADSYALNILPGTHRLQLVTVTYYTAEVNFRIESNDSLRIDFQLWPDQRTLY